MKPQIESDIFELKISLCSVDIEIYRLFKLQQKSKAEVDKLYWLMETRLRLIKEIVWNEEQKNKST